MRQLKLYLDTSVISYLDQTDSPEEMGATNTFWDFLQAERHSFDVCISELTLYEVNQCCWEKSEKLLRRLNEIKYVLLDMNPKIDSIKSVYVEHGVLAKKKMDDLEHIAYASLFNCPFILSWNMKDMVNVRTMLKVKEVNQVLGYEPVMILTPKKLMEDYCDEC